MFGKDMLLYRNKKTGEIYRWLAQGVEAADGREGDDAAIYCPHDNGHLVYVRRLEEFYDQFELASIPANPR